MQESDNETYRMLLFKNLNVHIPKYQSKLDTNLKAGSKRDIISNKNNVRLKKNTI